MLDEQGRLALGFAIVKSIIDYKRDRQGWLAQSGHMKTGMQQSRGNWQRLGISLGVQSLTWSDFPYGRTEVSQFVVQDNARFSGHDPRSEPKPKHRGPGLVS